MIFKKYVFEKIQWERKNLLTSILFIFTIPMFNYCLLKEQTSILSTIEFTSDNHIKNIIHNIIDDYNFQN